ncbi:MAG: class I tRNA ligase family protein, partial [Christensenellales bacterium]
KGSGKTRTAKERCKTIIEPLISSQWFVKMDELAKPAIEAVESGKIRFMDEQYKKTYLNWMHNIKDWCISRQIWSGHDIPIFNCLDCGEVIVEETDPIECPKCHSHNLQQELDKLDTWFSSALWPISTLGYPNDTEELKYFYPTNVMVTAREIINLWVARMIFSGLEYVGDIPFKDIVINGIVKDANGRKMSKTLGNGTDPIEMIDKYSVDALRFSLFDGVAIQSDSRFSEKKVELTRNFINKIWNASRYVLMQIEGVEIKPISEVNLSYADKWILNELNRTITSVDRKFEKYDIGMAGSELKEFFWEKFCDWYIELSKCDVAENKEGTCATLVYVLTQILKMLHPFIPFVTEKIYLELPNHDESIMISKWPEVQGEYNGNIIEETMNVIKNIRNVRAEKKVPDNKKINAQVLLNNSLFNDCLKYISKLALIDNVIVVANESEIDNNSVRLTFSDMIVNLPLESLVDSKAEKERIEKEIARLNSEIERSERLLNNAGFVAKAPASLIENEKEKLAKNKSLLEQLKATN